MASSSSTVANIVSALGGPIIEPANIDWATELPAGKRLVEWLASQLSLPTDVDGHALNETEVDFYTRVALNRIALEDEEVRVLDGTVNREFATSNKTSAEVPPEYLPPSRIQSHAEYLEKDCANLESETELLKSRSRQTKLASQKMSETINVLKVEIAKVEKDIQHRQSRISELSMKADEEISSAARLSNETLNIFESQSDLEAEVLGEHLSPSRNLSSSLDDLGTLSHLRAGIIDRTEAQLHFIAQTAATLPSQEELRTEAARLHEAVFKKRDGAPSLQTRAEKALVRRELSSFSNLLNEFALGEDGMRDALSKLEAQTDHFEGLSGVDMQEDLQLAWMLDHSCILDAKETVMKTAASALDSVLLPPLEALHGSLCASHSEVEEVEALLGALEEEIGDILDDVHQGKNMQKVTPRSSSATADDASLEATLVKLLKGAEHLKSVDAPALVLLDRNDVLSELRAILETDKISSNEENQWTAELPVALNTLMSAHDPLLTRIYQNTPVNTSSPFSPPPGLLRLQEETKRKSADLVGSIGKLQKEIKYLENDRTKRKLEGFVDKWRG